MLGLPLSTLNRHPHVHARASCCTYHQQVHPQYAQRSRGGHPSCDPAPRTSPLFGGNEVCGSAGTGQWLLCLTVHLHATPPRVVPQVPTSTATLVQLASCRHDDYATTSDGAVAPWIRQSYGLWAASQLHRRSSSPLLPRPLSRAACRLTLLFSGLVLLFQSSSIGTTRRSLLCAREHVRGSLDGIPPSFLNPFRGGKLSQIFSQRFSRASARRHRKTVFPHLFRMCRFSTFYVLFSENGFTVFPSSGVSRRHNCVCEGQYSRCSARSKVRHVPHSRGGPHTGPSSYAVLLGTGKTQQRSPMRRRPTSFQMTTSSLLSGRPPLRVHDWWARVRAEFTAKRSDETKTYEHHSGNNITVGAVRFRSSKSSSSAESTARLSGAS